ncbi:MAG: sporulation protein RMD1 [Chlamydiae bacterium]|nr:sporulation protein RMD1 [Chlamydiota bacterium]
MRCTTFCTASSYEIPRLFAFLLDRGPAQLFRNVIHAEVRNEGKTAGDVFYFSYGTIVFWGLTPEDEEVYITYAKQFEQEPNQKIEIDEFSYVHGEKMNIEEDEIVLQNKSILTKLSISHGLAQSVKLMVFEELIQQTILSSKNLPKELAQKGKIPLSRKEISRRMGELFIKRSFINLHSEILDVPEFFWDYPELEPFYRRTAHYLDVHKRVDALNKRLTVVHELFEMLSDALNHQHSSRLEWIIIILIVIEVILAVLTDIFDIWGHV